MKSLREVINEGIESIAIVGASPVEGKVGNIILKNLINYGFKGKIYPVNPKYKEIMGLKTYPNISSLPEVPDVVVIAVPPRIAINVLDEASKYGAKLAVIITAGFREVGNIELDKKLHGVISKSKMRVLGPNSAGITLSRLGIHASIEVLPTKGPVGLVMQSGALGGVVISRLRKLSSGISFFFSLGNMSDIEFSDVLDYALQDEDTESLIAYIEWLRNGRKFMDLARKFVKVKPLCLIKGGWGVQSSEAVKSHTGGLATNYEVFKAVCRQIGAYLAEDLDELVEVCEIIRRIKSIKGRKALIVTNSGGLGVITASHLESAGIDLRPLPEELKDKVVKEAGKSFSGKNPIDFGGDATIENVVAVSRVTELSKYYDILILVYVPTAAESAEKISKGIRDGINIENVPVITYFDGEGKDEVMLHVSKYVPIVSSAHNLTKAVKELARRGVEIQ